eukprot:COSAG02_NODE_1521_length_12162_cov_3.464147_9_plen_78_part_00
MVRIGCSRRFDSCTAVLEFSTILLGIGRGLGLGRVVLHWISVLFSNFARGRAGFGSNWELASGSASCQRSSEVTQMG